MEDIHLSPAPLQRPMETGLKSVNQAMKIIGSSRLDEERPCLGSEATAPQEESLLPLPERITGLWR